MSVCKQGSKKHIILLSGRSKSCWGQSSRYLSEAQVPLSRLYWFNVLSLSNFTPINFVDKYENVWTSRSLRYLSPGQAGIFRNFEPCCKSCLTGSHKGWRLQHLKKPSTCPHTTLFTWSPLYVACDNIFSIIMNITCTWTTVANPVSVKMSQISSKLEWDGQEDGKERG